MKRTLIKAVLLVSVFGLVSGCATTEQIAQIQATADKAMAAANNAAQRADNAMSTANEALDAARSAQSAAQSALECCNENSSKLDRMFEKAMAK